MLGSRRRKLSICLFAFCAASVGATSAGSDGICQGVIHYMAGVLFVVVVVVVVCVVVFG